MLLILPFAFFVVAIVNCPSSFRFHFGMSIPWDEFREESKNFNSDHCCISMLLSGLLGCISQSWSCWFHISFTFSFWRFERAKRRCLYRESGDFSFQESFQKEILSPLLSCHLTFAENQPIPLIMDLQGAFKLLYFSFVGNPLILSFVYLAEIRFFHRGWFSEMKRQSHLLSKAKFVSAILLIPKPLLSFGAVTFAHFKRWELLSSLGFFFLQIFSIFLHTPIGALKIYNWYVGRLSRVALMRVNLPPLEM